MKGIIFEVDEATQRGTVKCVEEDILMSNLAFRADDQLTLTADMVGRPCTFDITKFPNDVRATEIRLVELEVESSTAN